MSLCFYAVSGMMGTEIWGCAVMDEKQLLEAIRGIVRGEAAAQTEIIEERLTKVEAGLANVSAGQTKLEVSYENQTQQILNLLREDYSRVADAAAKTADYDDVKSQVAEHRNALENHSQRLTELEKKAI